MSAEAAAQDDHHSPLTPERYLRLRVEPLIRFYQKRLPQYYSSRSMAEGIIITGSLAGAILAICQIDEVRTVFASSLATGAESSVHGAQWTGFASGILGAVMAWR